MKIYLQFSRVYEILVFSPRLILKAICGSFVSIVIAINKVLSPKKTKNMVLLLNHINVQNMLRMDNEIEKMLIIFIRDIMIP